LGLPVLGLGEGCRSFLDPACGRVRAVLVRLQGEAFYPSPGRWPNWLGGFP
jgi:hypothetical protein